MDIRPLFHRYLPFFLFLNFIIFSIPGWVRSGEEPPPLFEEVPLPKSLSICGERMPLENRHVREMLDRELTISAWDQSQVFMWLKRAGRYFPFIEKEIARQGLPQDFRYLAVAESSLLMDVRSSKGAMGAWQFMAQTARGYSLREDHAMDERRHFEKATEAALRHLKDLKESLGSWTLAMAAYNCGGGRLKREMDEQQIRDFYRLDLPQETERYVFRIAAIKLIMENPRRYGYVISPDRIYRPLECDIVPVLVGAPIHITDLARALATDFKVIKELNPHILGYHLPVGQYLLTVPEGLGPRVTPFLRNLSPVYSETQRDRSRDQYLIQSGDTLNSISKKTGVSVDTLKGLNNISGNLIKPGETLRLRP